MLSELHLLPHLVNEPIFEGGRQWRRQIVEMVQPVDRLLQRRQQLLAFGALAQMLFQLSARCGAEFTIKVVVQAINQVEAVIVIVTFHWHPRGWGNLCVAGLIPAQAGDVGRRATFTSPLPVTTRRFNIARQRFAQPQTGPVQPHLYCAGANAEPLGGLFRAELLDIAQYNHGP